MDLHRIVDCHTHSHFSPDSHMSADEAIQAAINAGLGGITLTDHVDLDYPRHAPHLFDYKERYNLVSALRGHYKGIIKIFLGIELGFQPQVRSESAEIVRSNDFDLVLNSTHVVDYVDVCNRPLNESWTQEQVYRRYLSAILESVSTFNDFDVVGHIGFITRYVSYADPSLRYVDYADLLDSILRTVIQKGKGIEVNTAGYAYGLNTPHPGYDVLARYKELGGEILTLGSDAHTPEQISDHFPMVIQKLRAIGFTAVTYFEKRKPVFVDIA